MQETMMTSNDKGLVRAIASNIGHVFEYALRYETDFSFFVKSFLVSDTYDRIFYDYTLFSQAPGYIYEVFKGKRVTEDNKNNDIPKDAAYWLGYLFTMWRNSQNISGRDIVLKYRIERIISSYDMLHTQDINYAIEFIENNFTVCCF